MAQLVVLGLIAEQQRVSPLAMTIEAHEETYFLRETVRVAVGLENRTDKPIAMASVVWDKAMAAGCRPVLTRGGRRVDIQKGSTVLRRRRCGAIGCERVETEKGYTCPPCKRRSPCA